MALEALKISKTEAVKKSSEPKDFEALASLSDAEREERQAF